MEIPKDMILNMIESRFGGEQAQQAQQLPDQVDHEQHAGLLNQFGQDPQEALSQFTGGSGTRPVTANHPLALAPLTLATT